ncbi:hypothetical protein [Methylosinus sp. Ce-a6]|uniref:hypothetical protein n=1 Tax=Methylosinus sp. Ce-a6 TaxID=2172005 RepID=UPI0013575503|nr:hypothetical protein [Methylosinus sp. Ce-a6]
MANFQKHGKNVHGQVLSAPGATSYELGLWGPIDIRDNSELTVSTAPPNLHVKLTRGNMLPGQPVRVWKASSLPLGRTVLVAQDAGGLVWTQVTIDTSPGGGRDSPGKKYTDNPNESPTTRTTPTAAQVVNMLLSTWPDLEEQGARTLTAQFMAETGNGRYCFNWNLGNVKAKADEPHMYLRNVWECDSQERAEKQVASAPDLAHIATADEIAKHGWKCPKTVVVFNPPHAQCRFRAYPSLAVGAQRWVAHHKSTAAKRAEYLDALNAGDVAKVAHILKSVGYYTAAEADYARLMKLKKAEVDRQLGPLS